jgi:hypothetical protein
MDRLPVIHSPQRGGEEQTTAIGNVQNSGGRTILQGAENRRGWSMTIDHSTGDMT